MVTKILRCKKEIEIMFFNEVVVWMNDHGSNDLFPFFNQFKRGQILGKVNIVVLDILLT